MFGTGHYLWRRGMGKNMGGQGCLRVVKRGIIFLIKEMGGHHFLDSAI